jgi:hypothetical protein
MFITALGLAIECPGFMPVLFVAPACPIGKMLGNLHHGTGKLPWLDVLKKPVS